MRVLVTGARGTLGREVVAHLTARGWSVRAHDRTPPQDAGADPAAGAAETACGDLLDPEHARSVVTGMDAVVHAAALPSPTSGTEQEVFSNNVLAAYQVLDAAGRAGVPRIVYVSSLSALGMAWSARHRPPTEIPVTERHPYLAEDVYGLSKHLGELIAETTARRWGSTVVSLRFPFLGSGDRLRDHLRYVQADPALDRGALWSWLDTRDAARGIEAALIRPLTGHHLINLVAPDTTATRPTRELLTRYHPSAPLDHAPDGYGTPYATHLATQLLGFTTIHGWRQDAARQEEKA
ncbi:MULTISPECIES: NAD(P)-dependent oxidoreductase [Streptacidiphilus]|uniref:NAD-dependent epimerase/dehydratase family protein n=1 Tax=Streptacidiphilus cavernicola TaxID=3342716 RepID=A0ABV6UVK7_9ACTN|nr:NAD(P)-dependent oxidoreductase [Streptacidiphilus jeojiense]